MKASGESLYFLARDSNACGDIIIHMFYLNALFGSYLQEHAYSADSTLNSLLRLICSINIDSALVIHPLHAKQSLRVTVAFSYILSCFIILG